MADSEIYEGKGSFYWILPGKLHHYPEGHDLYDPRSDEPPDEALAQSLIDHGMRTAMRVRSEGGKLYIVNGRRRHRAVERARAMQKAAGVPVTVQCKVEHEKGNASYGMLVDNLFQRPHSDVQKGEFAARLEAHGESRAKIARLFGVTPQTIAHWIALGNATADVKAAVQSGAIGATVAAELSKAPAEVRKAALADPKALKGAGAAERVRKARRAPAVEDASAPVPPACLKRGELRALREALEPAALDTPDPACDVVRAVLEFILGEDPKARKLLASLEGAETVCKILREARK